MAETFFGPWRVTAPYSGGHMTESFVISGSDNSDGPYVPPYPDGVDLEVTGERWTIDIQLLSFDEGGVWLSRPVRRTNQFIPPLGLVVTVERSDLPRMKVTCVSRDPRVNPPVLANPYDFTYGRTLDSAATSASPAANPA
jgi:hypothetical protein